MRSPGARSFVAVAALALTVASAFAAPVVTQSALAQLGLTEAAARNFLFEELKAPASDNRRSPIAIAGHRAFYKLPAAARGPAATALFAWARAYVNSPAFKAVYAQYRKDANPFDERLASSADRERASMLADMKTSQEMARQIAASLPPAEREKLLAQMKEQEKQMAQTLAALGKAAEAEQAEKMASNKASVAEFDARFPADPNQLVARRLREFLADTADADFSARIIRLTDGPAGMEFISPAHQKKSAVWQMAVLAGAEATKAARAAAEAWLKEVTP